MVFKKYFENILNTLKPGDAREESFYDSLKNFIEMVAKTQNKKVQVTILPKKYKKQLPDFRIRNKTDIIGHIEAKDFQKFPESKDKAKEIGIDWWEHDAYLSSKAKSKILEKEKEQLQRKVKLLEAKVSKSQ